MNTDREPKPLAVRLAWFLGIWAASIAVLGVVAGLLRWWLTP